MAVARVPSNDNNGTQTAGTINVAYPNNPVSGNTLICCFNCPNPPGSATSTGWTVVEDGSFNGATRSMVILAKISAGAGDKTFNVTNTGGGAVQWHVYEYSGLASSITLDGTPTINIAGSTTVTSSSITLTNAGSLFIAAVGMNTDNGGTGATPFNNGTNLQNNAQNRLMAAEWLPGSTGAKTTTATWVTSRQAGISAAAFQPPAAVTTSKSTLMMMGGF